VKVYTTQDIPLNMELGKAYDAPFWYQPDNGLTSRQQAAQIKTYYRRSTLPPWKPPLTTKSPAATTFTTATTAQQPRPDPTTPPHPIPARRDSPAPETQQPIYTTHALAISASTQPIPAEVIHERRDMNNHYGLDCTLN
jgi:hypothetical protein